MRDLIGLRARLLLQPGLSECEEVTEDAHEVSDVRSLCAPCKQITIVTKMRAVKSSQVKSSQIQNGGRQSASFGAPRWRERSGGQNSAQLAPLDKCTYVAPSRDIEGNHHPHLLVLDHCGAPGLQHCASFRKSTVRQCNTASGRRWERSPRSGHARVLLVYDRWAEVLV